MGSVAGCSLAGPSLWRRATVTAVAGAIDAREWVGRRRVFPAQTLSNAVIAAVGATSRGLIDSPLIDTSRRRGGFHDESELRAGSAERCSEHLFVVGGY